VKVEWSPLALDRVSDIARYIAKDNPGAAEQWVNELFDSVERLADLPESGRVVPEFGVRRRVLPRLLEQLQSLQL